MSFRKSLHESGNKVESMTEIFHGKYFHTAESCPLRIDVNRFPIIVTNPRPVCKGKSVVCRTVEGIILPAIRDRAPGESSDHLLHMNALEELQELDSCYRPSDAKAKNLNQNFSFSGPSVCKADFDGFTQQSLEVVVEKPEEKLEESNALKRWEYWMKDKRRMQGYLAKRLHRKENRLLIQDSDRIRRKLEERWLSTCTRIPQPDKWRGHPFRWKAQFRLPNNKIKWNDTNVWDPPEYCAIQTSLDRGEIPAMEFIGIPRTVQKEKGFSYKRLPEKPDESFHKEDTEYFKNRRRQLKPHDIDMDSLEVIGKQIIPPAELPVQRSSDTVIPEITVDDAPNYENTEEDPSVFCLVIGNEEIKYNLTSGNFNAPYRTFHWRVDFKLNTVGVTAERTLKVENRGTVAIRYHWLSEKPPKPMNLEKLQPRQYEPWFFFNKNSGFFLPGQIHHLKFYHHSKFSGIRKEVWHLKTEPPLSLSSDPCTVTLSAIATEEFSSRNPLETYLFNRVSTSIAKTMIDIILEKVLRPCCLRGIEYRSLFSNKLLFEYNNPKRYYNSTIVNGLNKIYREITPGPVDWDLSLDTLVCQIKARRIGKDRNSILLHVAEKANLLLKPTYVTGNQDKKYRMAYAILCKMTNFMEDDYIFFRSSLFPKILPDLRSRRRSIGEESGASIDAGEYGEFEYYITDFERDPINFFFFKIMLYIKVYNRICEAVEQIAGMLETRKLFEPWMEVNYKIGKPPRKNEGYPFISNFRGF